MVVKRILVALFLFFSSSAWAEEKTALPKWQVLDSAGKEHSPAEWKDSRAAVLVFLSPDCPVSNGYVPELNRLAKSFSEKKVLIWGIYADPDVTSEIATAHAKEFKLAFPVFRDPELKAAHASGVKVTPEVAVMNPKGKLIYHGRIDDRYGEDGIRREVVKEYTLQEVIEVVLDGKAPKNRETKAFGCPLTGR